MNTSVVCKQCKNCEKDFVIETEDFAFYEKMKVPPPTWCPDCRLDRRLASLNHRSLYKRTCSKCSDQIFSMYHSDSPFVVYCTKCYFSDDWDGSMYSQEYDFSKPFFLQIYELMKRVPQIHLEHQNNNGEGIQFSNYIYRSSRTYLSYGIVRSEDIFYSWGGENGNRMCMDSTNFRDNENCYDLVTSNGNYNCSSLTYSHQCIDSQFLYDCTNCTNCFMSSNLRNKSYVFYNQQYTREVYLEKVAQYRLGDASHDIKLRKDYDELMKNAIHRFATLIQSENCTGDFIFNSKNVQKCFSVQESENIKYGLMTTNHLVEVYDFCMSGRSQSSYEFSVAGRGNNHCFFSYNIGDTDTVQYCDSSNHIKNCFGCVGLNNKQYSILNKQYTKEEYEELVPKIIEHMNTMPYIDTKGRVYTYGEYFPIDLSRFAYNETAAFEFSPISKEEVLRRGFTFREYERRDHQGIDILTLPNLIESISEDIVNDVFMCAHESNCSEMCTNAFRITKDELVFYKKMKISLPTLCPNCRHFMRAKRSRPYRLWHRQCNCSISTHDHTNVCPNEFETSYDPDRAGKVYCRTCYQQEVL